MSLVSFQLTTESAVRVASLSLSWLEANNLELSYYNFLQHDLPYHILQGWGVDKVGESKAQMLQGMYGEYAEDYNLYMLNQYWENVHGMPPNYVSPEEYEEWLAEVQTRLNSIPWTFEWHAWVQQVWDTMYPPREYDIS